MVVAAFVHKRQDEDGHSKMGLGDAHAVGGGVGVGAGVGCKHLVESDKDGLGNNCVVNFDARAIEPEVTTLRSTRALPLGAEHLTEQTRCAELVSVDCQMFG